MNLAHLLLLLISLAHISHGAIRNQLPRPPIQHPSPPHPPPNLPRPPTSNANGLLRAFTSKPPTPPIPRPALIKASSATRPPILRPPPSLLKAAISPRPPRPPPPSPAKKSVTSSNILRGVINAPKPPRPPRPLPPKTLPQSPKQDLASPSPPFSWQQNAATAQNRPPSSPPPKTSPPPPRPPPKTQSSTSGGLKATNFDVATPPPYPPPPSPPVPPFSWFKPTTVPPPPSPTPVTSPTGGCSGMDCSGPQNIGGVDYWCCGGFSQDAIKGNSCTGSPNTPFSDQMCSAPTNFPDMPSPPPPPPPNIRPQQSPPPPSPPPPLAFPVIPPPPPTFVSSSPPPPPPPLLSPPPSSKLSPPPPPSPPLLGLIVNLGLSSPPTFLSINTVILPNLPNYLTNNFTFITGGSTRDASFNMWSGPYYTDSKGNWNPYGYGSTGQFSLVDSAFQRSADPLVAVTVTPDGKQVLAAYQQSLVSGYVNMINTADGKPAMRGVLSGAKMGGTLSIISSTPNLTRTAMGNGPWAFAWSPLDQSSPPYAARVASSGADRITALCLSQDGGLMVAGASDGSLTVFSLSTPGAPSIMTGYQEPIVVARLVLPVQPLGFRPDPSLVPRAIGVSRSGNVIAAAFGNNVVVWMAVLRPNEYLNLRPYYNPLAGPVPPTFTVGHQGKVTQVYISADGTSAFTGACDGTVSAWDLTAGGKMAGQVMISGTGSTTACCTAIAFGRPSDKSGSALLVVTASDDDRGEVRLWADEWVYSDSPEV